MAGEGYAKMGQASRGLRENRQNVDKWRGILADVTSVATFGLGQRERAKTAWGEYEKGYESITGDKIDTSRKFGDDGWFKRTFTSPRGEIIIGDKSYQMENIRKAGGYLGGEQSIEEMLHPDLRKKEALRLAGGKALRPKVPVTSEDEFFDEDITIKDIDFPEFGEWEKPVPRFPGFDEPVIKDEGLSEEPTGVGDESLWDTKIRNNRNRIEYPYE